MKIQDQIKRWLLDRLGRPYCASCIADEMHLIDSSRVRELTIDLASVAGLRRLTGTCTRCGKKRHVIEAT
jgi:hypothetical protein